MGKSRLRHLCRLVNHPVSHHEVVDAILLMTVGTLLMEKMPYSRRHPLDWQS
jgi:hypothetical protein